ncbi:cytochrome-c peroxidase [Sorangium sp. So ce321]|uniref:cytochrome-c peroxidase n=1 Tax=Sorangium sp. So ce321 TaxID=3133300 RepID=UPI003F5FE129
MHRNLSCTTTRLALAALSAIAAGVAACSFPPDDSANRLPSGPAIDKPPPPISGGTLLIARDGHTAVAADPDRDGVWVFDTDGGEPRAIPLERGDEPGRVVEDGAGRVHVALRRAGELATIDVGAAKVLDRRAVCPAPRGLAYDASLDAIHVACAGGELVTLPAQGGAALRKLRLDADLRDVLVEGDRLLVSRFRSAETLVVGPDGEVLSRRSLPSFTPKATNAGVAPEYRPSVAWRMVALPGGGAAMVHQRALTSPVVLAPTGYYGGDDCDGDILHGAVSVLPPASAAPGDGAELPTPALWKLPLPVDIAVAPDGKRAAVVSAGSYIIEFIDLDTITSEDASGTCRINKPVQHSSQPIAVAFTARGVAVVQFREPARIEVLDIDGRDNYYAFDRGDVGLPGDSVGDPGHALFHEPPSGSRGIACASCHPEAHEDGHTWRFDKLGLRRTQTVAGGVLETAPFHWSGDQSDLTHLMQEVFVSRMHGVRPLDREIELLARFLDSVPAFPASPPDDLATVRRGEALFHDPQVGCATCHAGPMLTNNRNEDVGFGEAFQVPSLIGVSARAPFMHDGCAKTLRDRFDPACGGDRHGDVSALAPAQLDDLVAYLESL